MKQNVSHTATNIGDEKKIKIYEGPSKDHYPKFEFLQFICFQNDIKEIHI